MCATHLHYCQVLQKTVSLCPVKLEHNIITDPCMNATPTTIHPQDFAETKVDCGGGRSSLLCITCMHAHMLVAKGSLLCLCKVYTC